MPTTGLGTRDRPTNGAVTEPEAWSESASSRSRIARLRTREHCRDRRSGQWLPRWKSLHHSFWKIAVVEPVVQRGSWCSSALGVTRRSRFGQHELASKGNAAGRGDECRRKSISAKFGIDRLPNLLLKAHVQTDCGTFLSAASRAGRVSLLCAARAVTAPRWRAPLLARSARTVPRAARLLQRTVVWACPTRVGRSCGH